MSDSGVDPLAYVDRPRIIRNSAELLGTALAALERTAVVQPLERRGENLILIWSEHPRLLTGNDVLQRLLRGLGSVPNNHDERADPSLP